MSDKKNAYIWDKKRDRDRYREIEIEKEKTYLFGTMPLFLFQNTFSSYARHHNRRIMESEYSLVVFVALWTS